jgi:hypothetical protein
MAGITYTAAALNSQAGLLVQSLWTSLEEIRKFKLWLDDATHTDAILTAAPFTVPQADLTAIRAAFGDLGGTSGLYAVAHGTFDPSGANNFFFNAKNLTGLNYAA